MEWAELSGCRFFTEESFEHDFEAIKARLFVGEAESVVNPNNAKLRDGCQALGYRWCVLARNSRRCDPALCSFCTFGCPLNGKQSAPVTYLKDAQDGDTTIIAHCRAERVVIANEQVTGVEAVATDPETGRRHEVNVRAPIVVVAAGAINTPVLLIRSGVSLSALGRNLFLHPTALIAGIYKGQQILPWVGPPQSIMSDQFAEHSGNYGFRLETAPAHPGLIASALPWFDAQDHRSRMERLSQTSFFIALVRDRASGCVRRDSLSGRPIIEYTLGKLERELLRHGNQAAARIHWAAGADEILSPHTRKHCFQRTSESRALIEDYCAQLEREPVDRNWMALYSAHQMGTARMGSSGRDAVCNAEGEVFTVKNLFIADASVFPASSGVNPMLTIMALAKHIAQCIKER
jgi:choline dehydrogenase-like flavoprotein